AVELGVPLRVEVLDALDVRWPMQLFGILRSRDNEFLVGEETCWRSQQLVNLRLTVRRVRSHVAQVAGEATVDAESPVLLRIKGTVQRHRPLRAKAGFQLAQDGPTSKAEVHVEDRNLPGFEIARTTIGPQGRYSYWRIDVVKRLRANIRISNLVDGGDAVRKIRSHHHRVSVPQVLLRGRQNFTPVFKQNHLTETRFRKVAVRCVPLNVLLEEDDLMPARM